MTDPLLIVLIIVGYVLVLAVGFLAVLAVVTITGPLLAHYDSWLKSIAKRWLR